MTYVTHARTLEELKDEVCSDICRRIERLELQVKHSKSTVENAKHGRAIAEFQEMLHFWTGLQLMGARTKRLPPKPALPLRQDT